ncbi:MAG: hypothetical protein U5Q03_05405 [Bacteroidota bacterium]|nr:hypothetical protein [Bacteroidota bacterium]
MKNVITLSLLLAYVLGVNAQTDIFDKGSYARTRNRSAPTR